MKNLILAVSRVACAVSLVAGVADAVAAPITWQTPVAFDQTGSALNQSGSVVSAFSANGNITVNYTGGSVAFSGTGSIGSAMSFAGFQGLTPSGSNVANYSSGSNPNFGVALSSFLYDGWQTVTLNNLVAGHTYAVQMFSLDNRGGGGSLNQWFQDAAGNASNKFMLGSDSYVIGSFTADATTELIKVFSDYCHGFLCTGQSLSYQQSNIETNINAVVLRDTTTLPEPGSLALAGLAGLGLARSLRSRRK